MHNRIIKIFKQLSFVTAHPDADWMKIFILTFMFLVYSVINGIFLYIDTVTNIESLGTSVVTQPVTQGAVQKDDELTSTIKFFEEKKKKHDELLRSKPTPLSDPISS